MLILRSRVSPEVPRAGSRVYTGGETPGNSLRQAAPRLTLDQQSGSDHEL